jgi:hypothetical protein
MTAAAAVDPRRYAGKLNTHARAMRPPGVRCRRPGATGAPERSKTGRQRPSVGLVTEILRRLPAQTGAGRCVSRQPSQKIQKTRKSLLTLGRPPDYIRLTNDGGDAAGDEEVRF